MAGGRFVLPSCDPVLDVNGVTVVGASLAFYNAGTSVLANIFADAALSTPVANPQTGPNASNADGRFYTQTTAFWADNSAAYDVVLTYPSGQGPYTYSNQYVLGPAPTIAGFAPIDSPTFIGNPKAPTPAANNASASIATTQFVATAIAAIQPFPTGMIGYFANLASVPATWLPFSSTAVSRTTYANLFAEIGTLYGPGDGSTSFNLPPPGYFPRAANTSGTGPDAGRSIGSIQLDAFQGFLMGPLSPGNNFYEELTGTGSGNLTTGGGNGTLAATTGAPVTDGTNGTPRISTETRPVNIAFVGAIKT